MRMSQGLKSRTRKKFKRKARERGLSPITRTLQKFETNEQACVYIDSSIQKGQPHHRFHGLIGRVVGTQGNAYLLDVRTGKMTKRIIVAACHLRKYG